MTRLTPTLHGAESPSPVVPHTSGGAFAFELLLARLIARSDAAVLAR